MSDGGEKGGKEGGTGGKEGGYGGEGGRAGEAVPKRGVPAAASIHGLAGVS